MISLFVCKFAAVAVANTQLLSWEHTSSQMLKSTIKKLIAEKLIKLSLLASHMRMSSCARRCSLVQGSAADWVWIHECFTFDSSIIPLNPGPELRSLPAIQCVCNVGAEELQLWILWICRPNEAHGHSTSWNPHPIESLYTGSLEEAFWGDLQLRSCIAARHNDFECARCNKSPATQGMTKISSLWLSYKTRVFPRCWTCISCVTASTR